MILPDFMALLPLLITGYTGAVLMLVIAFWRSHTAAFSIALLGLLASLASIPTALYYSKWQTMTQLRVDAFSIYFVGLILAASILVALLSREYLDAHAGRSTSFYVLLLFATLGMGVVAVSSHFIPFFLGLETLSISLYGLIGYTREHRPSIEGAIKYLVMAAVSSAFLLFGIGLVYTDTGTMAFATLGSTISAGQYSVLTTFGIALVLVLFGFKLALAPFHMWSPDVYQGAPSPVTALIATGSKGALLALLFRLMVGAGVDASRTVHIVLAVLAVATMFTGNLLALLQTNVKRLLAYSSVAQMGYLLLPVIAGGTTGASSLGFYLLSYFATTIAAFGVIAVLSTSRSMGDVELMDDYRGLAYSRPILAACMGLALLSLTGIPPTAGFIAKFYIFTAAVRADLWPLVIIAVVNSGISAFYYLRLLVAMYTRPEPDTPSITTRAPIAEFALLASTAIVVFFGIYPTPLIRLTEIATRHFGF